MHKINRRKFIASCLPAVFAPKAFCAAISDSNQNKFEPFKFVFLTDCHLTSHKPDSFLLLQESQLFLQQAIKEINLLQPDFVIFGGNQIHGLGEDESNWQLFLDIVQTLESPWYFVLGESDIIDLYKNKMRTYGPDWKGKGLINDAPYWTCHPVPGLKLIGLDTSQTNSNIGNIDDIQINWLKEEIARTDVPVTILISHHPLILPENIYRNNDNLLPEAESIRNILQGAKNQVVCLSGHTHSNKIIWQNNIWYISSASLDVYPCVFRYFKVSPQEIEIETHQINFPALVKKAKIDLTNSNLVNSLSSGKRNDLPHINTGNHNDQNAKLSLEKPGKIEPLGHLKL